MRDAGMTAPGVTIAVGSVDITPQKPVGLGGYSGRTALFQSIADPLEANVLVLAGPATRVVFVTIDSLFPGRTLREHLLTTLGLKDEELVLVASHTHFAPLLAPELPGLGQPAPDQAVFVAERIAALVRSLEGKGRAAQCFHSQGKADHAISRRLKWLRLTRKGLSYGAGLGPNPGGEKDERIAALRFCDDAGQTVALLWNYACHPTDFPERLQVSADYPGVVRARLREAFGDVPVLFLQGFAGDVRPPFSGTTPSLAGLLHRVLLGPQFRRPAMPEWRAWADGLAARVVAAFRSPAAPLVLSEPVATRLTVAEALLGDGGGGDKPLVWHKVECGGFRLLAVNAEPVTAYRRLLEPHFTDKLLLTAGYIDQTHCYLPVDSMLDEGGYEVEGFRPLFGYRTRFRKGMQAAAIAPLLRS